jgi:hypothetical protein
VWKLLAVDLTNAGPRDRTACGLRSEAIMLVAFGLLDIIVSLLN